MTDELSQIDQLVSSDPVLQAMFCATAAAVDTAQSELLEAVLADDHRAVRKLLDDHDQDRLLADDFFLPLSVLIVCQASQEVLREFAHHGYRETTHVCRIASDSSIRKLTWGRLAVLYGTLERHRDLVETGFLTKPEWCQIGMGRAQPEVFDFWNQRFWSHKPKEVDVWLQAARWLSGASTAPGHSNPAGLRAEVGRRLQVTIDGFLDEFYPAATPSERWAAVLASPFDAHKANLGVVSDRLCVLTLSRILDSDPMLCQKPIPELDLSVRRGEQLAASILEWGFSVFDFEQNLLQDMFVRLGDLVQNRRQAAPSSTVRLWGAVIKDMERRNDPRLSALPEEMRSPGRKGLSFVFSGKSLDQQQAALDLLRMSLTTNSSPAAAPRPRL